jgi:hypothetical protein
VVAVVVQQIIRLVLLVVLVVAAESLVHLVVLGQHRRGLLVVRLLEVFAVVEQVVVQAQ